MHPVNNSRDLFKISTQQKTMDFEGPLLYALRAVFGIPLLF